MKSGSVLEADFQLAGGPSVLFDTVYVVLSDAGGSLLSKEAAAVVWVHDAFSHLKVIGSTASAQPLLDAAGVVSDAGILIGAKADASPTTATGGRIWEREVSIRTIY